MRLMNLIVPFLVVWLSVRPCVGQANAHAHGEARSIHHGPIAYVAEKVIDLGDVRQHERISGSFVIENHGNEDLVIKSVFSHCGCTVVELDDEQKVIPPDRKQEVSVFFSSEDRQGRQRKQVTVITNDPEFPITRLTVKGNVLASFRVEPSQLVALSAVRPGQKLAPLEVFPTSDGATMDGLEIEVQGGLLDYALESIVDDQGVGGIGISLNVSPEIELGPVDTQMILRGTVDGKKQAVVVRVKGSVVGPIEVRPTRIESTHSTPRGRVFAPVTLRPTDGAAFDVLSIDAGPFLEGSQESGKKPGDIDIVLKLKDNAPDGPIATAVSVSTTNPDMPIVRIPVFVDVRPRCRVEPALVVLRRNTPDDVRRVRLQTDLVSTLEIREASCDNPRIAVRVVEPVRKLTKIRFIDLQWAGGETATEDGPAKLTVTTNVPGAEQLIIPIEFRDGA